MSNISPDFIYSVGSLYEEINIQQQDFLNEDSEYYDAEMSYLVEDILSTISTSMVYEGYSADGIIGFLADSSSQDILEKYLTFDENILTESVVDEDYIVEQLEIFDLAINEGLGGRLIRGALGLAGRIASKPARMKVAKIMSNAPKPERARELLQTTAQKAARKANVGGYSATQSPIGAGKLTAKQSAELLTKAKIGQVTQKVKDIASKAKAALPGIAKGLGIFGLGAAGGFFGAKMGGAGSKTAETPKPSPTPGKPPTAPAAPAPAAPAKPAPSAPAKPKPADSGLDQYKNLIKQGKTKEAEALGMQQWAKANPKLAARLNPDGTQKGTGQSQMEKDAEELRKMTDRSKQRQGELMGGPEGPGKIDTKAADEALKAQQERDKERAKRDAEKAASSMKESHEPYDIILEYLMSRGHVDTIEEAHYIMLEMDSEAIQNILEVVTTTGEKAPKAVPSQAFPGRPYMGLNRPYQEPFINPSGERGPVDKSLFRGASKPTKKDTKTA
jgi:hypothetical protein